MVFAALIAFGLTYCIYNYWNINKANWILLFLKTFGIFVINLAFYVVISAILKIEFVGELIERIGKYIKRKIKHN